MNIIVLGDSIAWGAFDKTRGGWVEILKSYLFQHDCFVYNCSISGDTSANILKRMNSEINSRLDPIEETGIIVAIGANDCGFNCDDIKNTPLYNYENNLRNIYDYAKRYTNNIAFVGLTPVDDYKTNPVSWDDNLYYCNTYNNIYDAALKTFCKEKKVDYIDLNNLSLKQYLVDGVHFDAVGHRLIFEQVQDKIKHWYTE